MNRIFSFLKEKRVECILTLVGVILMLILILLYKDPTPIKKIEIQKINNSKTSIQRREKISKNLSENIEAKSFYVLDMNTSKMIFAKNENEKMPLASLTKLMSSLVISENLPSFTSIPITKDSLSIQGDNGLYLNEDWKLKDLMDFSLITSSNDGMFALASVLNAFESTDNKNTVILMNQKAKELNLSNTEFFNETGLDLDSGGSGGFSSSKDTANLISYILKNNMSLLSATAAPESKITSESNIVHVAKNTNQLSEKIPSLIASKTGFTDLAGGNLAISFEVGPSKPVIAVIMGSSIDGRFTDMEKVVNSTLQYYSNLDL